MSTARTLITAHLEARRSAAEGHALFPRRDWEYEVANGDTTLGYDAWLEAKIAYEIDDAVDSIDRFLFRASKIFTGEISEIEFNKDVVSVFSELRISDDEAVDRAEAFLQLEHEPKVFGEVFGTVPAELALELSRIAHLGMVAFEGRCTEEKLLDAIEAFCQARGLDGDALDSARRRLVREEDEPGPEPLA